MRNRRRQLGKVDWVGIMFMVVLAVSIPTCYYQQGVTERHSIDVEAHQNSCPCQVDSTEEGE